MPATLPGWTPGKASKPKPTGVFSQPIGAQHLAPVRLPERQLPPPANIPAYPVKRHYSPQEQATIVHGTEQAAQGVNHAELLAHPVTRARLEPYFRVKAQQQTQQDRQNAQHYGVTPPQARRIAQQQNTRSGAQPRNLQSLLQDHGGFDLSSYLTSPQHNLLAAGYPGVKGFLNDAGQLSQAGKMYGQRLGQTLQHAGRDIKTGKGSVGGVTPGFLRLPLGGVLSEAGKALPVAGRIAGGAGGDLIQYTLGAVPSTVQLLSHPKKAPGVLLKGSLDAISHPLDHPLFALQLLHGAESAVARPIGAIGRSGVAGKRVAQAFSTERAPLAIGGPAAKRLVEYRHYSRDPLVKTLQVQADKRLPEGPTVSYHGRDVVTRQAKDSKVASMLGRDVAGRLRSTGDFVADRANAVERSNRAHMQRELLQALPTRARDGRVRQAVGGYFDRRLPAKGRIRSLTRPEQGVIGLVMTGVVRSAKTFEHDLNLRLTHLAERARHPFDTPDERTGNLAAQDAIKRVLANPKALANADRIVAAGRQLAHSGRRYTAEAVRQGALSPEAAARAPLFDYAMTHMGARYFTAEEHHSLEQRALVHERTAAQHVQELKASGAPRQAVAQAQEVYSRTRDYRIAVSGRHPTLVDRHERAQAEVRVAAQKAKVAGAEHARAEKARQRLLGVQSSRRGRRGAEAVGGAVTKVRGERLAARATTAEKAKLAKVDRLISETKARRKAAEAAHRDARTALEKAKLPDAQAGLRHGDGRYLPNEDIHAHMAAGDPHVPGSGIPVDQHGPLVSYLPHRPDVHDRSSYHRAQALLRRDSLEGYNRTGKAFAKGITGSGMELISDHLVRMGITTGRGAIGQFDQLVHDAGVKRHDGSLFTPAEAEVEAKNLSKVPGQPELVPVRAFGARLSNAQQALIRKAQDPLSNDPLAYGVHTDIHRYVEQAFNERKNMGADRQARNVVLMPKALVDRFEKHLTATSGRSPLAMLYTRAFRTAVLPFSAKWLTGNIAEGLVRLALIGANPFDYTAGRSAIRQEVGRKAEGSFRERASGAAVPKNPIGRAMLKEIVGLDAEKAGVSTEVRSTLLGGLFYGERGLTIHRDTRDFEDSRLRVPAEAIGGLGKTTVVRELGHTIMAIPEGIFAINRFLERQAQITALGRYVRRDIQEFTGSWAKSVQLQHEAVRQAAKGLFDTPQQRDAAKFMDITLGQYSRFSPRIRGWIQTFAPFLPWYLNSTRFVFWTMPISHPLATSAILASEKAFQQDITAQHKDVPPGELKSAVPYHGGYLDLARYTPFGAFTAIAGGDLSTATSPLFPQIQGIQKAIEGKDPFGRDLTAPKTASNPQGKAPTGLGLLPVIGDQLAGSVLPWYSTIERLRQHGETPYGTSTQFDIQTKPGTSHGSSGLERTFNPLRPVFLKQKKSGKPFDFSSAKGSNLTGAFDFSTAK